MNTLTQLTIRVLALLIVPGFALLNLLGVTNTAHAAEFGVNDFKGEYVATFSGNLTTSGTYFAGYLYLNSDGLGNVSGSWVIQVPAGGLYGGPLDPSRPGSGYTVDARGRVQFTGSDGEGNILRSCGGAAEKRLRTHHVTGCTAFSVGEAKASQIRSFNSLAVGNPYG